MPSIILVAEDYEDTRELMVYILSINGFEVYSAANGQEALEIAQKRHPDLILMDISMPIMDGLQATRYIRALDDDLAHVPIIAITAFDKSYWEQALAVGCNQVIQKPVDLDELDSVIEKYLAVC